MTVDSWTRLRRYTQARIALGRAGCAVPTKAHLEFQLAHAEARDAVHVPWDLPGFARRLREAGLETVALESAAPDRHAYLQRPDLGRRISDRSRQELAAHKAAGPTAALIVSDGLSSTSVERHGAELVTRIVAAFRERSITMSPVFLVRNGRVALSDEIGETVGARLSVMIVGERPGLSASDSLGIYLTWSPRVGRTDAERNCLSNIRPPDGLGYGTAVRKLIFLSEAALRLGLSGVHLKEDAALTE